jgi:hypothetical protein
MPFEEGNTLGKKSKIFDEALKRAIAQDSGERVRKAAEQLLSLAAAGEQWAVQYLADRLDGKPSQAVDLTTQQNDGIISQNPLTADEWQRKHGHMGPAAGPATRAH